MARTQLTGREVGDGTIQRRDIDISTTGEALIRKIIAGTGISISSTGADAGTGDVTVNVSTSLQQLASLGDPDADRIIFWDDSAGAFTYLTLGTNLSITGTTLNAVGGGGGIATSIQTGASLPSTAAVGDVFMLNNGRSFEATATNTWAEKVLANTGGSSANQIIGMNAANTGFELKTITAGTNVSITHAANSITINASTGTTYTDEDAQDAVGLMIDSTLVYVDATPLLTRAAITGDISISQGSNSATLATVNSNVGTFNNVTVNAKGLVTAASNVSYLTSYTETSTLANVTGRGNTTSTGLDITESGNTATSYALRLTRNTDTSSVGYFIQARNAVANTNLFTVDTAGNLTAASLVRTGGTASQFLKADGSVDSSTYLTANQSITLSGDVSGTGATAITTTIGTNKVTLGMMAQITTASILGRNTAATGNVEVLSGATVKSIIGLANVENTALSTWTGNTAITSVGTIGTGTWQGTIVGSTYGGTGVNNAGRTLTINTNSGTIAFSTAATTLTVANTASVSGTNTGDQTITLSGDISGSGTAGITTAIGTNKVTLGMLATLAANSVIGNNTGSTATPIAIAMASSAAANALSLRDTNANAFANNFITNYTSTATAAGTTTLTVSSGKIQVFTGTTTQTVTLPVTSTLTLGHTFTIYNNSTGVVTVQSSGANTIQAMAASSRMDVVCILTSGTTAASWSTWYTAPSSGGMAIGGAITNSPNAKSVLYVSNSGGTLAQSTKFTWDDANNSILLGDYSATGGVIGGLDASGGFRGGDLTIKAGAGQTTLRGGDLYLQSGLGGTTGSSARAGDITISIPSSNDISPGGAVSIGAGGGGPSGGVGGSVTVQGGSSNVVGGGGITLTAGSGNTTGGTTLIKSGDGTGTNASGGYITLKGGTKTGTGTAGIVRISSKTGTDFYAQLSTIPLTTDRTYTFPDKDGTIAMTSDIGAGGGITNSAGANVIMKSNGTNAVASILTDDGTTVKLGASGFFGTSYDNSTISFHQDTTQHAIRFSPQGAGSYFKIFESNSKDLWFQCVPVSASAGITSFDSWAGPLQFSVSMTNALYIDGLYNISIGNHTNGSARVHIISTGQQLRWGYDVTNYSQSTVSSTGAVTFDAAGTGAGFTFGKDVSVPNIAYANTWTGVNKVPTQNAVYDAVTPTTVTNSSATYNGTATFGRVAVLHNASGGNITHNLPTAVGNKAWITIIKTDTSANTVTIDGSGSETIVGGLTAVLTKQYESVTLVSDNANWFII